MNKIINFIKDHKIYSLLVFLSTCMVIYLGYINVWQPAAMLEDAKIAAGGIPNFLDSIINYLASPKIIRLFVALAPFLAPIILLRYKNQLDVPIKKVINKVKKKRTKTKIKKKK